MLFYVLLSDVKLSAEDFPDLHKSASTDVTNFLSVAMCESCETQRFIV